MDKQTFQNYFILNKMLNFDLIEKCVEIPSSFRYKKRRYYIIPDKIKIIAALWTFYVIMLLQSNMKPKDNVKANFKLFKFNPYNGWKLIKLHINALGWTETLLDLPNKNRLKNMFNILL
jgi:hypothetical protein